MLRRILPLSNSSFSAIVKDKISHKHCIASLAQAFDYVKDATNKFNNSKCLHTSTRLPISENMPSKWLKYNEVTFPPRQPDEPQRPGEVCYTEPHIRYQHDKMLYLCRMVRGMSIDEAKKQLTFKNRAGAEILKQILETAQDQAMDEHNFEFKSNMWIAEAFPRRAGSITGIRKHRGPRFGKVKYSYIHVFVKLREGPPPESYYEKPPNGNELRDWYIKGLRQKTIINAL